MNFSWKIADKSTRWRNSGTRDNDRLITIDKFILNITRDLHDHYEVIVNRTRTEKILKPWREIALSLSWRTDRAYIAVFEIADGDRHYRIKTKRRIARRTNALERRISVDRLRNATRKSDAIFARVSRFARSIFISPDRKYVTPTVCFVSENASESFHAQGPAWIRDKKGSLLRRQPSLARLKTVSALRSRKSTRINP